MYSGSREFINYGKTVRNMDLSNKQCNSYIRLVMPYWRAEDDTVPQDGKIWQKANPEVNIEVKEERNLPDKEWLAMNFPFFGIPMGPQTHVNHQEWKAKL